jgi:hypothetical protein
LTKRRPLNTKREGENEARADTIDDRRRDH